jgi:D-arabinose 1-dehydrogenase-like Zn-dependent alcohol dehydrogenase
VCIGAYSSERVTQLSLVPSIAGARLSVSTMTSQIQAGYRIHEWDADPQWEEFEVSAPGPGEVVVEVEACGVGLTVLNAIRGDLGDGPELLPRVPGHELVGRVVNLGTEVDAKLLSQRVVAYFYLSCSSCSECLAGRDPLCRHMGGYLGVHRDGGYAPHVVLPSANVIPIPDLLDPVAATVVPDAVATPVHVSTRVGINADDRVVVIGAGGGVGIHMIQVARLHSDQVVGLDVSDGKLRVIEEHGARALESSDFTAVPRPFADGPPTVVVDLVGSEDAALWSLETLGPRGRLVVLTTFKNRPIPVEYRGLVFHEIDLMGSRYATKSEVLTAADLVATGRIRPVIGEVVGPEQLLALHQRLRTGRLLGRGALKWV